MWFLFVYVSLREEFSVLSSDSKAVHEPKKKKDENSLCWGKISPFVLKPALAISIDEYNASFPGCHCPSLFPLMSVCKLFDIFSESEVDFSFFLPPPIYCDSSSDKLDKVPCSNDALKNKQIKTMKITRILRYRRSVNSCLQEINTEVCSFSNVLPHCPYSSYVCWCSCSACYSHLHG